MDNPIQSLGVLCILLAFVFHHTYEMVLYVVSLYPHLLHSPQSLYNIVATILYMYHNFTSTLMTTLKDTMYVVCTPDKGH